MSQNLLDLKTEFLQYVEIERGRSLNTVRNYDQYLSRFIEYTKIKDPKSITDAAVRDFRIWLNRQDGKKEKAALPAGNHSRTGRRMLTPRLTAVNLNGKTETTTQETTKWTMI